MESIVAVLALLNNLSPLAVIALLGIVLFYQAKNRVAIMSVSDNHLSGLPDMAASLTRIENLLQSINNDIIWLRAKVGNGNGGR